jgi:hypothetical protein
MVQAIEVRVDEDPEKQKRYREYTEWQARNLVNDLEELASMSEADIRHYC